MPISFVDRRCTVDVRQTSKGYSFESEKKIHRCRTQEAVHRFFLSQQLFDTVKLRFKDESYYLHFTLDEPEKFRTKRQLRTILSQECEGAWIEEKNGKQRYFLEEGWVFSAIREVSFEEFALPRSSLMQKVATLFLGSLAVGSKLLGTPKYAPSSLGLLGCSLLHASPVAAQMPAFGEFRINSNTMKDQSFPSAAALKDGGFVVAWMSNQTEDYDIYGQRYNALGAAVDPEFRINTNTTSNQDFPRIAALSNGGFVVTWWSLQTGNAEIYGQRFDALGAAAGLEFRVGSNTTNIPSIRESDLVGLNDGGFVVAWNGKRKDGIGLGTRDIYGQRYDSLGVALGLEFRINTNTTFDKHTPSLAALNYGGFVAAWSAAELGSWDIDGQRFNVLGAATGPEFHTNTNVTGEQIFSTLAGLKDGGFVAAWNSDQTGDHEIYGRMYDVSGAPVGSEFRVNTNTTGYQYKPKLIALNDGGFVAVWDALQDVDWEVYVQRYNASGAPVGSEFRANTNTTNFQRYPVVVALNDGGFVVIWHSGRSGANDIYGQRYDASGAPVISLPIPAPAPFLTPSQAPSPAPFASPVPAPSPVPFPSPAQAPTPFAGSPTPSFSSSWLTSSSAQTSQPFPAPVPSTLTPSTPFQSSSSTQAPSGTSGQTAAAIVGTLGAVAIIGGVGALLVKKRCFQKPNNSEATNADVELVEQNNETPTPSQVVSSFETTSPSHSDEEVDEHIKTSFIFLPEYEPNIVPIHELDKTERTIGPTKDGKRYKLLDKGLNPNDLEFIRQNTGYEMKLKEKNGIKGHFIDAGNFGVVWVGREDGGEQKFVAIKQIEGKDQCQLSEKEGAILETLRGVPNIIPFYGESRAQNAEVMYQFTHLAGFGNGRELAQKLAGLEPQQIEHALIDVAKGMLNGVSNMHSKKIFHLDLKWDNVVFDIYGETYLIDFGNARKLPDNILHEYVQGDTEYFPPERFEVYFTNQFFEISAEKIDAWGVGVTLLNIVKNTNCFQKQGYNFGNRTSIRPVFNKFKEYLENELETMPRSLPPKLATVIRGLLRLEPDARMSVLEAKKFLQGEVSYQHPLDRMTDFASMKGLKVKKNI